VIVILPETKGISLERMDKLFGELDAVDEGEKETSANKIEAITYSGGLPDGEKAQTISHVEEHPKN